MAKEFNTSTEATLKTIAQNLTKPLPVTQKTNYSFHNHIATHRNNLAATAGSVFIDSGGQLFKNEATGALGTFYAPPSDAIFHVVSTSAQDAPAGTGLITMAVFYLTDDNPNIQSQIINLNGLTPVSFLTAFWRIIRILPITVGSSNFNVGTITFTDSTNTFTYPGTIAPLSNKFTCALASTPRGVYHDIKLNGSHQLGNVVLDYLHFYNSIVTVPATAIFRTYGRQNGGPWQLLNIFVNSTTVEVNIPTNMGYLSARNNYYDFAFVVVVTGAGMIDADVVFGYHIE